MLNLLGNIRYAATFPTVAGFRHRADVGFGNGGTTAIFTLIHAVMLRSLPVSDPGRLYRVGDGDDCCVEGGHRGSGACFRSRCTTAQDGSA